MTIEEKLKDLILTKYRSIREFTQIIDMPYSTFSTIINRGLENSSVTNVIKICKALGISADALADGKIVHVSNKIQEDKIDIDHVISDVKGKVLNYDNLLLRGKPIDPIGRLLLTDYLDVILELAVKQIDGERVGKYVEQLSKKP